MVTNRTYTAPVLCLAAGINPSTLRSWRSRGLIQIEKEHERSWTLYTANEALRVCALAQLTKAGVAPVLAAALIEGLAQEGVFDGVLSGDETFSFVILSNIALNVDDPKKPQGPGYEVRWGRSTRELFREVSNSSGKDDVVWQVVDVAKIWKNARTILDGEE